MARPAGEPAHWCDRRWPKAAFGSGARHPSHARQPLGLFANLKMAGRPIDAASVDNSAMARPQTIRPLAAEFLGTLLLLVAVVGSGIMAERLSGGNVALALLANALATGAVLVVLVTIFAPLSGAHFNPCGHALFRPARRYRLVAPPRLYVAQVWRPSPGSGWPMPCSPCPCWKSPPICARDRRNGWRSSSPPSASSDHRGGRPLCGAAIPMLVGLYITGAYWFTASTSFANPAVTLARLHGILCRNCAAPVPGFIAAQFLATLASALVLPWLFARD